MGVKIFSIVRNYVKTNQFFSEEKYKENLVIYIFTISSK